MTRPELLVAQCGPAAVVCVPCSVHSTLAAVRVLEDVCLVLCRALQGSLVRTEGAAAALTAGAFLAY